MKNKLSKRNENPAFLVGAVIGWLFSAFCRTKISSKYKNGMNEAFSKVYTIVNPDEYDKMYGLSVEIGVMSVEEYYYTKGRIQGFQAYQLLHQDSL
jgi:hypothetical protein